MKYLIFLFLTFNLSNTFAVIVGPSNFSSNQHKKVEEIITNVIYEQLYEKTKNLKPEEVVKKVKKVSLNDGRRGKSIIEKLKQKNREKLARMRGFDPDKVKSGKDLVKMQKADNKLVLKKMSEMEWTNMARSEMEELKKRVLVKHKEWRKKHLATLKKWDEKKEEYKDEVDEYKKTLIDIPLILPVSEEDQKKDVQVAIKRDHFILAGSMGLPIRDQKRRPTCSSFAGIRAVEVMLEQNQKSMDLSEQYFYWASKPKCQNRKCSKGGSWVGYGFTHSKSSAVLDIPLEKDCPYREKSIPNNETQIPLGRGCNKGAAKLKRFSFVRNLDGVINSLSKNRPVLASLKLTPNFYGNKGLVLQKEAGKGGKMDAHAQGHSVLFIGYVKLPKVLNEGSVCFVTSNSWGFGWGYGGYSCLSERWVLENRQRNPFVSVLSVEI
jgi:C1A family cysteine protease